MIKIDTSALNVQAEQIKGKNGRLTSGVEQMAGNARRSLSDWRGNASSAAIMKFNGLIDKGGEARSAEIDAFVQLIQSVVAPGYEATEESNESLSERFK